ncbi:hypothetical protein MESS4_430122 [Mesorhizobium sp. STM 4661]|nr:hypothetical protein MESS4_430122 [Mesorhizobium sp. STM 4661]
MIDALLKVTEVGAVLLTEAANYLPGTVDVWSAHDYDRSAVALIKLALAAVVGNLTNLMGRSGSL